MPFIFPQAMCLSLLTKSDIPEAKCNANVYVYEDRLHQ